MKTKNKQYGIDAEEELMKILQQELNKIKEERYAEIKDKAEDFMKISNNNLDALYKYLVSPYQDIEKIRQIAEEISKESGIKFVFEPNEIGMQISRYIRKKATFRITESHRKRIKHTRS